jgi:hypothetical protein
MSAKRQRTSVGPYPEAVPIIKHVVLQVEHARRNVWRDSNWHGACND